MRISTAQIFQQGIGAILNQQAQVQKTQQQLASGQRVNTPADDPAAAVQILDISAQLSRLEGLQRNADLAMGQLAQQDTVLRDAVDLLQRARELTVEANNASQTAETRSAIAVELRSLQEGLVALANSRDASGDYLFSGFQTNQRPFEAGGTRVSYVGDEGGREVNIADGVAISLRDSGRKVFMAAPAGNGQFALSASPANTGTGVLASSGADSSYRRDEYTVGFTQTVADGPISYTVTDSAGSSVATGVYEDGAVISFNGARLGFSGEPADGDRFVVEQAATRDVFATLQAIADSLGSAGNSTADRAAVNTAMANGLSSIDQALGHFLQQQTSLGTRMNQVESVQARNDAFTLGLQTTLSEVRDLDVAEAISRLQLQLATLEAAQSSYVSVQRLSLFDYL